MITLSFCRIRCQDFLLIHIPMIPMTALLQRALGKGRGGDLHPQGHLPAQIQARPPLGFGVAHQLLEVVFGIEHAALRRLFDQQALRSLVTRP